MIRKLLLALVAASLLAGCVTGGYAYRNAERGDYYYGRPTVEYRYQDRYGGYGPYGYGGYAPYGYGGFGSGGYGVLRGYYGYPYRYGGFYNHPQYRPYYRRPPLTNPGPDGSSTPPQQRPDDRRAPWRNFDELRRRPSTDGGGATAQPSAVPSGRAAQPRERASRMEQIIDRANRSAERLTDEQEP